MNPTKRMRVFAGPNGSGKSTLYKRLLQKYQVGIYINADLMPKAVSLAYRSYIFDNSTNRSMLVLEFKEGKLVKRNQRVIPQWIEKYLPLNR